MVRLFPPLEEPDRRFFPGHPVNTPQRLLELIRSIQDESFPGFSIPPISPPGEGFLFGQNMVPPINAPQDPFLRGSPFEDRFSDRELDLENPPGRDVPDMAPTSKNIGRQALNLASFAVPGVGLLGLFSKSVGIPSLLDILAEISNPGLDLSPGFPSFDPTGIGFGTEGAPGPGGLGTNTFEGAIAEAEEGIGGLGPGGPEDIGADIDAAGGDEGIDTEGDIDDDESEF